MVTRRSAGIVLFRRLRPADSPDKAATESFEVLLGHPGGPFFIRRDEGHWTIPKGEPDDPGDDLLEVDDVGARAGQRVVAGSDRRGASDLAGKMRQARLRKHCA